MREIEVKKIGKPLKLKTKRVRAEAVNEDSQKALKGAFSFIL